MTAFTNYAEELVLKYMLSTTSVSRPSSWFVALHTADPTEAGNQGEVTTTLDSAYQRKSVTFTYNNTNNSMESSAELTWTVSGSSSGYTVAAISIWDSSTSGQCLFKQVLPIPVALTANQVFSIPSGKLIVTLD